MVLQRRQYKVQPIKTIVKSCFNNKITEAAAVAAAAVASLVVVAVVCCLCDGKNEYNLQWYKITRIRSTLSHSIPLTAIVLQFSYQCLGLSSDSFLQAS
jgi:hypothetical protein